MIVATPGPGNTPKIIEKQREPNGKVQKLREPVTGAPARATTIKFLGT